MYLADLNEMNHYIALHYYFMQREVLAGNMEQFQVQTSFIKRIKFFLFTI